MELYITDLQAYNEGHLVGRWVQLPLSDDELSDTILKVLDDGEFESGTNGHEELFITDWDCEYLHIDEHDSIEELNAIANAVVDYDENDFLKLKFLEHEGWNVKSIILEEKINSFDVDIYNYSSDTSFTDVYELLAQDLVDEGLFGAVPTSFANYIDYSAIGRDLSMDYTEFEHGILARAS